MVAKFFYYLGWITIVLGALGSGVILALAKSFENDMMYNVAIPKTMLVISTLLSAIITAMIFFAISLILKYLQRTAEATEELVRLNGGKLIDENDK
ncbi:hypothetical protein [Bacillus sp. AFS041924]|uniref:hypothetical protein n=1 Tax=Bacillus sp. AFS041924 TaxID=2033503 RepID=UPI000BFCC90C|nr:hypothetical protein [Bacillus sp. AFS041924]PGS55093.1 hypothetical protein COC46_03995 [Bacillus sp. AFS041924]